MRTGQKKRASALGQAREISRTCPKTEPVLGGQRSIRRKDLIHILTLPQLRGVPGDDQPEPLAHFSLLYSLIPPQAIDRAC